MELQTKQHVSESKDYKLTMNGSSSFLINGLKKVIKSSPEFISLEIGNKTIEIYGKNFAISKLNVNDGILEVNGEISDFKIKAGKDDTPFFKRLFK